MFSYMTKWPITEMTGYQPKTTYWNDFETAEMFGGEKAIRDTYKRAKKYWCEDIVYMTEICMVLNWRLNLWYQRGNMELAKLYDELWRDCDSWILECEDRSDKKMSGKIKYKHFTEEEIFYFIKTTD